MYPISHYVPYVALCTPCHTMYPMSHDVPYVTLCFTHILCLSGSATVNGRVGVCTPADVTRPGWGLAGLSELMYSLSRMSCRLAVSCLPSSRVEGGGHWYADGEGWGDQGCEITWHLFLTFASIITTIMIDTVLLFVFLTFNVSLLYYLYICSPQGLSVFGVCPLSLPCVFHVISLSSLVSTESIWYKQKLAHIYDYCYRK